MNNITYNNEDSVIIPEFIEGIPTDKHCVKERFKLIVKHLRVVVENARPTDGLPLFSSVKSGVQRKNGYKNIIILYYTFESMDYPQNMQAKYRKLF